MSWFIETSPDTLRTRAEFNEMSGEAVLRARFVLITYNRELNEYDAFGLAGSAEVAANQIGAGDGDSVPEFVLDLCAEPGQALQTVSLVPTFDDDKEPISALSW